MSRRQRVRKKWNPEKAATLNSFSLDIVDEIGQLFNKSNTYVKPPTEDWLIPDSNEALRHDPLQYSRLQGLKESLNDVKNQLSDMNLEVWHKHTSFTNRAGKIIAHVRATANAEICTQAWCKFYEVIGTFLVPLIFDRSQKCGELNSVHLCEAPGAFIASLNHYLKSNILYCDWTWAASTLNPYHEGNDNGTMITDDRLIANTLPWWFFGSDDTGDLMIQKHLLELKAFTSNMRTIDLVTADGSFDCQGNPDEQEALVAPLHYCEAVTALLLLGHGGSFVLKMFTLFEHSSVCLLYLLNCCFRSVHVFKPATSKAGNSEVYVVCQDYFAKDSMKPLLSKLLRNFGPNITSQALFPNHLIPVSFLKQHEEICTFFYEHQVQTIKENLQLFHSMSSEQWQRLNHLRDCAVEFYMNRFEVRYLHRRNWLSKNTVPGCSMNGKLFGHKRQMGSFNERKELQSLTWKEKVKRGYYSAWIEDHVLPGMGTGYNLEGPAEGYDIEGWYSIVGATISKVRSSPFCDLELLNHLNEALVQSELAKKNTGSVVRHSSPCTLCRVFPPAVTLSEVLSLCHSPSANRLHEQSGQCLVVGSSSFHSHLQPMDEPLMKFSKEPVYPSMERVTLHDGDPQYQRDFLTCVLHSLHSLQSGESFVLPIPSAFTRFMAGMVLALHHCFRCVTFMCPTSSDALGPVAMLLCIDYRRPTDKLLAFLGDLQSKMSGLPECPRALQVLQSVPMEDLLKGALPEFLWNMNTAIARHRLHLLVEAEQSSIITSGQIH